MQAVPAQNVRRPYRDGAVLALGFGLEVHLADELRDLALLHQGMDVQDGFVAGSEDGLVFQQVQDLQLSLHTTSL